MKKAVILLANGLEECEALMTRDVLIRSGIEVDLMSIYPEGNIVSQTGLIITPNTYYQKVEDMEKYDALILPGGKLGHANLDSFSQMNAILAYFLKEDKLVCAICAAPKILGHRGLLKNKKYTCFKGCEVGLDGNYQGSISEVDGNIITGRSVYYTSEFALNIVEQLLSKERRIEVENSIKSM